MDSSHHDGVSLKVADVRVACAGVLAVHPDECIERAETLMVLHGYSQLAVTQTERAVLGAISWESIGKSRISHDPAVVRDATVPAEQVHLGDDLLPLLPKVADVGFVLVRGPDEKLCGIVTVADITNEYDALAGPFLLLGEIERRLKLMLNEHFDSAELAEYHEPGDEARAITGVDDLTLGEIIRIFERPDSWSRVGWRADRAVFTNAMHQVRCLRNRLMHFSQNSLASLEITTARQILGFLQVVSTPPTASRRETVRDGT